MRTRFPTLRTLPSSTELTPSFSPICRTSTSLPLKAKEEVREATCMPGTLARALMISSVMPSLKYSFSGSALMLASGRTAMALRAARGGRRPTGRHGRLGRAADAVHLAERLDELGAGGEPVHRGPGQDAGQRVVHRLGHVAGDPHLGNGRDEPLGDDGLGRGAGEGRLAGQHLVEHAAQAVQIGPAVHGRLAGGLLGAHVGRRARRPCPSG